MKYIIESRKFKHNVGGNKFEVGDYVRPWQSASIHIIGDISKLQGRNRYFIKPAKLESGLVIGMHGWLDEKDLKKVPDIEIDVLKYNL